LYPIGYNTNMNNIASFIKYQRKKLSLTQQQLAERAGVGLRFIREMEDGKETLRLDKVNQVLALFGYSLTPNNQPLDAYSVVFNYLNRGVKITLTNKIIKYGILIKEIKEPNESTITAWQFVPNNNAIKYQKKPDDALTEIIQHNTIQAIEYQ
jgi:y4mF family transcriptional regulator